MVLKTYMPMYMHMYEHMDVNGWVVGVGVFALVHVTGKYAACGSRPEARARS